MKSEGVNEELAVRLLSAGLAVMNLRQIFLNADFYYGSDAPIPLARLIKARGRFLCRMY